MMLWKAMLYVDVRYFNINSVRRKIIVQIINGDIVKRAMIMLSGQ